MAGRTPLRGRFTRTPVIVCFIHMSLCQCEYVTSTPAPSVFRLTHKLKQLHFSCTVPAVIDETVNLRAGPRTLVIWKMLHSGERRVLAQMDTGKPAHVTGNLTGAEVMGNWSSGTLTLTLGVDASQDAKGLRLYGCSFYYQKHLADHDPDIITTYVYVKATKKHYCSDPPGFEITSEFRYCLKYPTGTSGCCFNDSDVKRSTVATDAKGTFHDASTAGYGLDGNADLKGVVTPIGDFGVNERVLGDAVPVEGVSNDITHVCRGTLYVNSIERAVRGTVNSNVDSIHKGVNPVEAVSLRLDAVGICVCSKREAEVWICNALKLKENYEGELVHHADIALCSSIAIVLVFVFVGLPLLVWKREWLRKKLPHCCRNASRSHANQHPFLGRRNTI